MHRCRPSPFPVLAPTRLPTITSISTGVLVEGRTKMSDESLPPECNTMGRPKMNLQSSRAQLCAHARPDLHQSTGPSPECASDEQWKVPDHYAAAIAVAICVPVLKVHESPASPLLPDCFGWPDPVRLGWRLRSTLKYSEACSGYSRRAAREERIHGEWGPQWSFFLQKSDERDLRQNSGFPEYCEYLN
jgi:hypothetical protein